MYKYVKVKKEYDNLTGDTKSDLCFLAKGVYYQFLKKKDNILFIEGNGVVMSVEEKYVDKYVKVSKRVYKEVGEF